MRKVLCIVLVMMFVISVCHAKEVKVTIPDAKGQRVKDAFKGLYPIPEIPDPAWVNPNDGSMPPMIPKFTDDDWPRECIRMWIVAQVARYEQLKAQQAIKFQLDDALAQ